MPPHVAEHFALVETEMSRKGPGFRAANGSPIKHYGQRVVKGLGDQFQNLSLTAQVADVKSTLGSVHQMLRAGNSVHFETGNCYIEHMPTGQRTSIEEKHGTFEVGVWVPKSCIHGVSNNESMKKKQPAAARTNVGAYHESSRKIQPVTCAIDEHQGFPRQDERF